MIIYSNPALQYRTDTFYVHLNIIEYFWIIDFYFWKHPFQLGVRDHIAIFLTGDRVLGWDKMYELSLLEGQRADEDDIKANDRRAAWGLIKLSLNDDVAAKVDGVNRGEVEELIRAVTAQYYKATVQTKQAIRRRLEKAALSDFHDLGAYIASIKRCTKFVKPHSFRAYGAPSGDVRASFDVSPENKSDNCFSLLDKKDYAHSDDGDQWLYDDGAPKHFTTDMAFAASLARPSSGPLQFDISCAAISDVVDSVQDERTKAAGTRSCEAPRRPREARRPVLLFYN